LSLSPEYLAFTPDTPLPSPEEVRNWWARFGMLDNIQAHSEQVTRVALTVTDWLAQAGVALNRRAVEVGALVHDLAKTPCLGTERLHSEEGAAMLMELGYPELAYLVKVHVTLPERHPLDETMVVNYADKRVTHESIVDLQQRYDYIAERYGRGEPERLRRIALGLNRARRAEEMIFSRLADRSPADITGGQEG